MHFWQLFLATKELDEAVLKAFMHEPSLLKNFLSLVDLKNYQKQDNLKSVKHVEKVELVHKLLGGLGFKSVMDDAWIDQEEFLTGFMCNIVDDATFKNRKRINELWELRKQTSISNGMNKRQILTWVNSLLMPFCLRVKSNGGYVALEQLNDVLGVVKRKNEKGKFYEDKDNLLKQEDKNGDPFMDEQTGETIPQKLEKAREKKRKDYDTSKLDVGINLDDD